MSESGGAPAESDEDDGQGAYDTFVKYTRHVLDLIIEVISLW